VNTTGYGGRKLKKSARVQTNDLQNQYLSLIIEGDIEKFATINPRYLRLYGEAGKQVFGKVSIVPSEKYPFNIVEVKAINGNHISTKVEKLEEQKGQGYILLVENTLKESGHYNDTIQLRTDNNIRPFLYVKVYGNIFERPRK
jgi:hypothetical protein